MTVVVSAMGDLLPAVAASTEGGAHVSAAGECVCLLKSVCVCVFVEVCVCVW